MTKIIVVDDIRLSADTRAVHAENTVVALELLEEALLKGEVIDELWLDFDLSSNRGIGEQNTLSIASWLIAADQSRTPLVVKKIRVHSGHTMARELIDLLEPYFDVSLGELPDSWWWEQPEEPKEEKT